MRILLLSLVLLFVYSCTSDKKASESFDISIRLERDPGQINPFYATTSLGREVYQYVFLPLADFHPDDLELYPILVESIPEAMDTLLDGVMYASYLIDLKDDARWSDGKALTAEDYFFTIQMIKHPLSEISAWKPYFETLKKIELDPDDPTRLRVYFDADYMLSREVALTTYIMPSHIYDPEGKLTGVGKELIGMDYTAQDSTEIKLVERVNATVNEKTGVVQIGPYELTDYQTDEYIILSARENYWGSAYPENIFLQQGPENIIFRMVPDEITAINMAKEGQLDFIHFRSSDRFLELRKDSSFAEKWNFHTPQIMQYYYLTLNNKSGLLADREVRKAITHMADVDDYIQNIDGGLGTRTIGHFNPSKPYYNKEIDPVKYDIDKAAQILKENGWSDSDQDGILDKRIDGVKKALKLDFYITGSELSQKIALLFQESARKVGVDINIVAKSMALIRQENLANFNYDIAAVARGTDAAPDDPYSMWHSDNAIPGTANQAGYANPVADSLIEEIRRNRSSEGRKEAYLQLQQVMYDDYPAIFLYSPLQKMIISKRLDAKTSAKRPGYMANTFSLKTDS